MILGMTVLLNSSVCGFFALYSVWTIVADRRRRALLSKAQIEAERDHMWSNGKWLSQSEWEQLAPKLEESADSTSISNN